MFTLWISKYYIHSYLKFRCKVSFCIIINVYYSYHVVYVCNLTRYYFVYVL